MANVINRVITFGNKFDFVLRFDRKKIKQNDRSLYATFFKGANTTKQIWKWKIKKQ